MKICYVASATSIHGYRWVTYFADQGHDVHWASLVPSRFEPVANVQMHVLDGPTPGQLSPPKLLLNVLRMRRLIGRIRPDVIHAHYAGVNGLTAALSGFHPFVLTVWGSDILMAGKSWLKGPFVRWTLAKADLITCDADHMRDAMTGMGVDPGKIRLIYFGTDTEKFKPRDRSEELARRLGTLSRPTVISLRSLYPIYDVESLIRSVPTVVQSVPEVMFVVAGAGPEEAGLKALAGLLGVADRVRFVGSIPNPELPEYLALADVYVSTSLSDAGLAASTAEAMACSLPVVVTDSGENRRWVEDGVSGCVVPTHDPEAVAAKIVHLLEHADVRGKFGELGRRTIVEQNNFGTEMGRMEDLYREVQGAATDSPGRDASHQ